MAIKAEPLKLYKPIEVKIDNSIETVDTIYFKPLNIGELTNPANTMIFQRFLNKIFRAFKKATMEAEKNSVTKEVIEDVVKNNEPNQEDIRDKICSLDEAKGLVQFSRIGDYEDIFTDIVSYGPTFFDKYIFLDPEFKNGIMQREIKKQLEEEGDLFKAYEMVLAVFFYASQAL